MINFNSATTNSFSVPILNLEIIKSGNFKFQKIIGCMKNGQNIGSILGNILNYMLDIIIVGDF
jgi:hypothetical protein